MQVEHRWTTVPWRTSAGRAKNATPPRILPTSNRFGNLLHSSETILYLPDPPNAFHQSVHNARVSPAGQGTTRTRRKNLARYRRRLRARQLQLPGAWTFGPTPATATATPSSKTNPSTLFKIITAAVDNVFTAASAIFTSFGDELVDSGDTRDADGGGGGGGDAGGGDGGDTGGGGGAGRSGGDPDGGGGAGGSGGDPDGGGGGGAGGSDPDGGGGGGAGGSGDDEDQAKKQPIGDEEDEEESRESHDSAQQDATRGTGLYTYQLLVRTQRTDVAQHLLNDATAIITAAGLADLLTTSLSDTFALADRIVVSCNDLFDKDAEDETPASSQTSVYRNVWSSDDDNHHDHIFGEERQRYAQAIDQLLAGVAGGLGDAGGLGGSRAARHHDHGSDDAFHRDLQSAEDERSARLLAGDVGDGFGEAGEEELTARNDHQRARGFLAAESEEQQVREQATAERSRGQDPEYDISRILSDSKQFWESIAGLNITEGELSPEAQSEEIRTVVDLLFKNYPASSPEMGNSPAPASPVLRPATSEDGNEDVADELDNEKGSGLGLWGLPIRAPPSMAGIDVFAFTRARADELPPCLPKTGPKPHMANIRVPSIVKDKTAIGKDCWGCGTTIKVVGAHTPWGALCRGSACSRVIGSGWPLLDLAIAGDAAPVSLRRGGQGFARNGQATVEAGFVLHRNDQNRWLAVKAELNAEKAWLTGLHPEAEAKFTELVRGGNGVKECFTCAIAISGQARQCLWPTKQICQSCWWAWRDAFNSNRMEEAAEQFDPFVLWMLFSIARRQVQWTCLPCGKPCVSYRDTTTPGGPRLDAEYLNVFAGVLRTCSSCSSGWISYRRNLQRILQPEELMSPASEFIYWLQSPKETRCVIKNCPYVWNKTSGLVRPSALPPDEDWHRSGSRCSGFARSEYICSGHLERVGGVKACDMTPVVARELQEICACYEHQAKVPRRPAGWRSAFRAALTDARDQLVDGTRCFVLGCGAVYRSEDRSPWYPKELPNGEWYPFCPDCDKHVQKILNNSANLTPHTYLVYQHHITAKKILAETSYISIWDDFATEPAIPVMVYLTKYHLRRDTTVCAASPAFSTDPVISELFPVRISSRMGYNWHRRDNADHSGKKHRLPATFVGFILGGLNIFRYLFDVCRLNGRTTQDFVEAVTNEVFQIPSKARQACFFPDKKVIDNYNSVMAQEAEDVQLGPWKWGGKKHQQCHARAMGTGANEWKTKNPDTILQCAITGELFRVAGSHVNHSHFFAKCGCLMPMLSNTLLGQYETVLDHLLLQVYTGDDIAKATKIRRSIHDEMMKSFSAYVDGTAPIVQSAQRLVNTLKDDDEMMTWGGAALGDAEMCQKFYDEFTSSTDRPVALAFQDYLRLLCPKPITAEEYQKNLLWLRWEK